MRRTIAVKGVGSLRVKPDLVVIGLELEAKNEVYERVMSLSSEQIEELTDALTAVGFAKEDLKTTSFHVRADYRSEQNDKGMYVQVFDGYVCHSGMKLSFDLDMKRLGETLGTIGSCRAKPELNISFTVKDPEAANSLLLKAAADNARGKAEKLCAASGVSLGELQRIEYNWSELPVFSRTAVSADRAAMPMMKNAFRAEMTPEEIELSDSAAFIWEIC
jgi:uncharacterized protein YggE